MSLQSLVDNSRTDKNTNHSYLPVYDKLFESKRHTANHILEIGIAQGGSIKLWRDYFPDALIHAADIYPQSELPVDLSKLPDVICYTNTDAYSPDFLQRMYMPLDIVIDDGPHTFQSQEAAIKAYVPRLAKDGILVIEDIQQWSHVQQLIDAIPSQYPCTIEVHDLRAKKGRPDDILLILQKM
jgi:hypothetical protein